MKCVISVLGKDRSGVVAAIATTLADCGANIDDISQTILGEGRMFSMTMMVTLDPAVADFNTVQERLTGQIADTLVEALHPAGVIVVLEAEHMCMSMRGVKKPGAKTTTRAVRGCFETDADARSEALSLIFRH